MDAAWAEDFVTGATAVFTTAVKIQKAKEANAQTDATVTVTSDPTVLYVTEGMYLGLTVSKPAANTEKELAITAGGVAYDGSIAASATPADKTVVVGPVVDDGTGKFKIEANDKFLRVMVDGAPIDPDHDILTADLDLIEISGANEDSVFVLVANKNDVLPANQSTDVYDKNTTAASSPLWYRDGKVYLDMSSTVVTGWLDAGGTVYLKTAYTIPLLDAEIAFYGPVGSDFSSAAGNVKAVSSDPTIAVAKGGSVGLAAQGGYILTGSVATPVTTTEVTVDKDTGAVYTVKVDKNLTADDLKVVQFDNTTAAPGAGEMEVTGVGSDASTVWTGTVDIDVTGLKGLYIECAWTAESGNGTTITFGDGVAAAKGMLKITDDAKPATVTVNCGTSATAPEDKQGELVITVINDKDVTLAVTDKIEVTVAGDG